jgi:anti-anti-sigma regulatory factor
LKIQVFGKGRIGLINLPKYFDFNDKNTLVEKIPEWLSTFKVSLLILNFTQTEFIGSSGVYPFFQYMSKSNTKVGRRKVRIAIIGLCTEYEQLLEGMGIKNKFFLYQNSVNFAQTAHRALRLTKLQARDVLEHL